ncbi:MAG: DUF429 domain-containing protein [Vicinamibacterales bacterium]
MALVLSIDAAWTSHEPSGVALLQGEGAQWRCLAAAPSYDSFVACAANAPIDWSAKRFKGAAPDVGALLVAARRLAGTDVDLVALDMPVASVAFTSRRVADEAISKAFGGRGCSAHSPSAVRPGELGAELTRQLQAAGYQLATQTFLSGTGPQFIEVYPHPALLALLGAAYRVPYKVQKSSRHWPGLSPRQRIDLLLREFVRIDQALRDQISGIPSILPAASDVPSLSSLKRFEDALDALVCGWIGIQVTRGRARPYGDDTAAVWVPHFD